MVINYSLIKTDAAALVSNNGMLHEDRGKWESQKMPVVRGLCYWYPLPQFTAALDLCLFCQDTLGSSASCLPFVSPRHRSPAYSKELVPIVPCHSDIHVFLNLEAE